MKKRSLPFSIMVLVASALGCSGSTKGPPPEQASLGGEIVARVGAEVIPVSLVANVAVDQRITPREALSRLIEDGICAAAARGRHRDLEPPTSWLLTAARARWVADRSMTEARQGGPPTDAEVEALSLTHWREVARPPAVHVVHALAMRPKKVDDTAGLERARALASALRAALSGAKTPEEFEARARAVPHSPNSQVVVERLPAFTADGWITEGDGKMVEPFAKAAHTLAQLGDTSDLVETQFGWHVIQLIDRVPEQVMPVDARRVAFADETLAQRAHQATESRVKALRAANPVEVMPSAELLMRPLNGGALTVERGSP